MDVDRAISRTIVESTSVYPSTTMKKTHKTIHIQNRNIHGLDQFVTKQYLMVLLEAGSCCCKHDPDVL